MASLAAMMRRVRSSSSGQTALNFCVNPTALELMDRNHGRFQRRLLPLFIYAALLVDLPVSQPPRRVGIQFHFLSDARNAVPSNLKPLGSPMARASASLRVILGAAPLLTTNLGFPLAVTTSCLPSASPSTSPAL